MVVAAIVAVVVAITAVALQWHHTLLWSCVAIAGVMCCSCRGHVLQLQRSCVAVAAVTVAVAAVVVTVMAVVVGVAAVVVADAAVIVAVYCCSSTKEGVQTLFFNGKGACGACTQLFTHDLGIALALTVPPILQSTV